MAEKSNQDCEQNESLLAEVIGTDGNINCSGLQDDKNTTCQLENVKSLATEISTTEFHENNGQNGRSINTSNDGDETLCTNSQYPQPSPRKTESDCTNKSGVNSNSDDEFLSASEGSNSDEDDFIPVPCDYNSQDRLSSARTPIDTENCSSSKGLESEDGEETNTSEEDGDDEQKTNKAEDELEARKKLEESLTTEEIEERRDQSQSLKDEGNTKFRDANYEDAIELYTEALSICPLTYQKERSIMYSNRAACKMKKELFEEAIKDSSNALELHPHYLKALLRRAELYEKTEKLDEALKDYQQVIELDPSQHMARAACVKLAEQIKDRNEKMKEEMMGKLKELGNLVLRPFGLSTNNFQMQQDPNTGSYSVQFNQNPNNGS